MPNRSKTLGKRFEERVAKRLAKLWGVPPRCITRTLTSGTYAHDFGDIQFRCNLNPRLVIECKRDTSLTVERLMKKIPEGWISQLDQDLSKAKARIGIFYSGVIVWGVKYKQPWVITAEEYLSGSWFDYFDYARAKLPHIITAQGFYMFLFDDFFRDASHIAFEK